MIKRIIAIFILLIVALPVSAQTEPARGVRREAREAVQEQRKETRQNVQEARQEMRQDIKEKRVEVRDEMKEKREEVREEVKEKRSEVREDVKDKRVELREEIKVKREAMHAEQKVKKEQFQTELKARREEFKTKREEEKAKLKERLAQIKDERKKQAVEKIDAQLHALNERMLGHFSNVLDKLGAMLLRVKSHTDKAEQKGLQVEAVRGAILQAETMIAISRSAVAAQAGKTYTAVVSSEETLRLEVGAVRKALHDDLAAVRATVQAAQKALRAAAVQLAQIPKVDEEVSAESTTEVSVPAQDSDSSN